MPKPTNFDELYPGRFIKAGLFKGKKITLTIKDVDIEMLIGEDKQEKPKAILSFVERPMQHVMPKTNAICLKAMFGKELKDWVGKRVTLFAGQWNGEECVRVWGSPDISKELTVQIELPRRKPFPMTMHVVKAAADTDPRILTAWELLGWSESEGRLDWKEYEGDAAGYIARLNTLLDEQGVTQ